MSLRCGIPTHPLLLLLLLLQDGDVITLFDAPDFQYRVVHQASVLVRAVPLEREVEAAQQETAAAAAAAAATAGITPAAPSLGAAVMSSAFTASTYQAAAGNPRPSLRIDVPNRVDSGGRSAAGGGGGGLDHGSGGAPGRNIPLEIWQRRFLLTNLEAVSMEVLFRWGTGDEARPLARVYYHPASCSQEGAPSACMPHSVCFCSARDRCMCATCHVRRAICDARFIAEERSASLLPTLT
jgi:hypothetical protein